MSDEEVYGRVKLTSVFKGHGYTICTECAGQMNAQLLEYLTTDDWTCGICGYESNPEEVTPSPTFFDRIKKKLWPG